jgi:hypothetical protein
MASMKLPLPPPPAIAGSSTACTCSALQKIVCHCSLRIIRHLAHVFCHLHILPIEQHRHASYTVLVPLQCDLWQENMRMLVVLNLLIQGCAQNARQQVLQQIKSRDLRHNVSSNFRTLVAAEPRVISIITSRSNVISNDVTYD